MPSLLIPQLFATGGPHPAKIVGAVQRESKNGNPMLEITVKIGTPGNTVEIRHHLVFTPNTVRILLQFAEAIGLPIPQGEGEHLTIEADQCIGQRAQVELGNSERVSPKTGKPYLEITRWLPLTKGGNETQPF